MRQKITSSSNPRIRAAAALQSTRARKQQQRIVVFGIREVQRAVAAGLRIDELFVCSEILEPELLDQIEAAVKATSPAAEILDLDAELFRKVAYGDRFDGVVAVAPRPATGLAGLHPAGDCLVLVMEAIEKPGNVGAVLRSADGAGAQAVIAANPATDFFHPNSIRASVSTVFSMPIAAAPSPAVASWLVENRFQIVLASPDSDQTFFNVDLRGRVAIVLGNEAKGLDPMWHSLPGVATAGLPMQGTADSLNISAAATAILYLAAGQRAGNSG